MGRHKGFEFISSQRVSHSEKLVLNGWYGFVLRDFVQHQCMMMASDVDVGFALQCHHHHHSTFSFPKNGIRYYYVHSLHMDEEWSDV